MSKVNKVVILSKLLLFSGFTANRRLASPSPDGVGGVRLPYAKNHLGGQVIFSRQAPGGRQVDGIA